jgi:RimJ/RimL family protein N-acetyltransferase
MKLRSLGYRTDLIFIRFGGRVTDRGRWLEVESPANPTFHWGNLLIFDASPGPSDFPRWIERFDQAFAHAPEVRHMTFGWDSSDGESGEIGPFLEAGFHLEEQVVLTARAVVPPPHRNPAIDVRALSCDHDREAATLEQLASEAAGAPLTAGFETFKRRQMAHYRSMADAGICTWYGAFLDGRMVGDLGLLREGALGRFQTVVTDPAFRRRGVCGTLVYEVARRALEQEGLEQLVMVADEHYHAARIYETIGFRPTGLTRGLSHPRYREAEARTKPGG